MHVRKGDQVLVVAGNDKGKTGEVKEVLRSQQRVVIEGVNMRWKHKKPTQQSPKGERVEMEFSIHASNVMHVDPSSGKRTRKRPEGKTTGKKASGKKATGKKSGGKS